MGICITDIASYVPEKVRTNADLEKMVDTTDEWIRTRTGIRERRISEPDQAASDLMVAATKKLQIPKLDVVVVTTPFPDRMVEHVSDTFTKKIGLDDTVLAIDIQAECSGIPWAMASAVEMMENPRNMGRYNNVLLVSGDTTSKFTDPDDRATVPLFGDAAFAAILQKRPECRGIIGWRRASDRTHMDCLQIKAGGSANPASHDTVNAREHYMHFSEAGGGQMLTDIVRLTPPLLKGTLADYGLGLKDIDHLIPHQVNIRITNPLKRRLIEEGLREGVLFDANIERYGNCSCSSSGLALDTVHREGKIKPGDIIVVVTWGAGLKIGILILEWVMPQFRG